MTDFYVVNVNQNYYLHQYVSCKIIYRCKTHQKYIGVYYDSIMQHSFLKNDLVMFRHISLAFVFHFFIIYFCYKINLCELCSMQFA